MKLLAVFTTVGSQEDAKRLAEAAIGRGLAACVQMSQIQSSYVWKGTVVHEPEIRVLFKTTEVQYEALEATILELHPYELPDVHALEVAHAYEPYATWVIENSGRRAR